MSAPWHEVSSRFGDQQSDFESKPFVLSRIFAVMYALFRLFLVDLPDFQHFWVDFGNLLTNFEHFLSVSISRFLVN